MYTQCIDALNNDTLCFKFQKQITYFHKKGFIFLKHLLYLKKVNIISFNFFTIFILHIVTW